MKCLFRTQPLVAKPHSFDYLKATKSCHTFSFSTYYNTTNFNQSSNHPMNRALHAYRLWDMRLFAFFNGVWSGYIHVRANTSVWMQEFFLMLSAQLQSSTLGTWPLMPYMSHNETLNFNLLDRVKKVSIIS